MSFSNVKKPTNKLTPSQLDFKFGSDLELNLELNSSSNLSELEYKFKLMDKFNRDRTCAILLT